MEEQKGVSLIITLFIMIVILAVVLSVSTILYSEIKVIKNISNSVAAFYAADSGIEKVLYYDKKVIPDEAERGFCSMCSSGACTAENNSDHSMDCLDCQLTVLNDDPTGCDPDICNNCEISFNTDFDGRIYNIIAAVSPGADDSSILEIKSKGFFGGTGRKIDILTQKIKGQGALKIENASVNPITSQLRETTINISADVSTTDSGGVINNVFAVIQDSQGNTVATIPKSSFECTGCFESKYRSGHWEYDFSSSESGAYYVSLSAGDSLGNEVTENILTVPTGPSFEVYSPGEHSYPSVYINVDVDDGDVTITADITDVSGVLYKTAEIQGLTDIYTMQKIGGSYVAYIGGLSPGKYTVEIFATDNLLIKNPAGTYTKDFHIKK
jgi:hypothetical protein